MRLFCKVFLSMVETGHQYLFFFGKSILPVITETHVPPCSSELPFQLLSDLTQPHIPPLSQNVLQYVGSALKKSWVEISSYKIKQLECSLVQEIIISLQNRFILLRDSCWKNRIYIYIYLYTYILNFLFQTFVHRHTII